MKGLAEEQVGEAFHRITGSSGHNSYYKPNAVIGSCIPVAINKHLGTEAGMVTDRIIHGESFGIFWLPLTALWSYFPEKKHFH